MPILFLLLIVVPIAELYLIIQVGIAIGLLPTLALLFADAVIGSALLRHQSRSAWRRFNQALAEGKPPTKETADGAMVLVGGTLLVTPGFITDIAGVLLLLPPTRALIRRGLTSYFRKRFVMVGQGPGGFPGGGAWGPGGPSGPPPPAPGPDDQWGSRPHGDPTDPRGPAGRERPRRDYDVDGTASERFEEIED